MIAQGSAWSTNRLLPHFKEGQNLSPKLCLAILFCITQVAFNTISTPENQNEAMLQRDHPHHRDLYSEAAEMCSGSFTWLFQGLMQTEKLINMYCYGKEYNPNIHWFISNPSETSNVKAKQIFTWQTFGEPSTEASR